MNLSVPVGLLLSALIVAVAAKMEIKNPMVFASPHAVMIVIGGTMAAGLVCFPFSHFVGLFKAFIATLTGSRKAETFRTIQEIVKISEGVNAGRALSDELGSIKNPFLKESLELIEGAGLSDEELDEVLEKRMEFQNEKYKRDSFTFKTIGKFPPAFGLLGTTMGMIALLQGLGGADAMEHVGPAMSTALVATFYGLIFANVILVPMGENLSQAAEEDLMMRRIVVDGVRLIREQKHPLLVREVLKSYLSPKDRNAMSKAGA